MGLFAKALLTVVELSGGWVDFGVLFALPRVAVEDVGHGRPDRVGVEGVNKALGLVRFDFSVHMGAFSPSKRLSAARASAGPVRG